LNLDSILTLFRISKSRCQVTNVNLKFFKSFFLSSTEKACDWMVQAASGVKSDRFLTQQLFPNSNQIDVERLSVLYFLKVIQVRYISSVIIFSV